MRRPYPFTKRLFALIIGINEYKSPKIQDLKGAVPDAIAVRDFLLNLGVPSARIRNLHDSKATRAAIIDELKALSLYTEIKEGDPILIYYAGHGDSADIPKGWVGSTGRIELLAPYDYSSLKDGNPMHGIPDRTFGALLSNLASLKGNNITVILDCCHSGSGSRNLQVQGQVLDPSYRARGLDCQLKNVPSDLDKDIFDFVERGVKIPSGFVRKGLRSHILLAACESEKLAYERMNRGVFTVALIDTLADIGIDNLTYTSVLDMMPHLSSGQSPQCEGLFRERSIFNASEKASHKGTAGDYYKIRKLEGDAYVMDVGEVAGITVGTEFDVYQIQNSGDLQLVGIVVAHELSPSSTTLYPKESTGSLRFAPERDAVAVKSRTGTEERVQIHVTDERLKDIVKKIDPNRIQLVQVERREDGAKFGIALETGKVVFNNYDADVMKHGLTRMPHTVEPTVEAISPVIRAAAHFYFHRHRIPHTGRGLAKNIKIEVNELEEDYDEETNLIYNPATAGFDWKVGEELNLQTRTIYGWKITNNWADTVPLYPSLFYFDNGDWSITPYYEPPVARGIVDPPLKGKGCLTVGYGDGGWVPQTFFVREGQKVDVGILKLFLSKKQVDLSHIAQSSPFVPVKGHSTSTAQSSSSPPPPPFLPIGGRSNTTPSLPFDFSPTVARGTRPLDQAVMREGTDSRLPWDTIEIRVVQRPENKQ